MPELTSRDKSSQDQSSKAGASADHDTDPKTAGAQAENMQGLQSPEAAARAAIKQAGLPIDHLIPDNVVSFDHKKDGSFTLKLGGEVRIKIDNVTLVMTQSISGRFAGNSIVDVKGIYGEKKVAFFTGKGNITKMGVEGDLFVVNTDNSAAERIEFKVSKMREVSV